MIKKSTLEAQRIIAIMIMLAVLATVAAFAGQVHVQIANAKLKKSPQWFAATVAEPALDDTLEVLKTTGDWYQVKADDTTGWIHKSAVTAKKAKKSRASSVGSSQTSADDITLAGKGFNELEAGYRKSGETVNLEAIDAMEARSVDEARLLSFLRKGALLPKSAKRGKK
ncbi:MAG: SH3 domain-containing protein [Elusimicrobiota bacterium]|nr:SH3 domain-containing protein [Elusimicrobiota bacterium]